MSKCFSENPIPNHFLCNCIPTCLTLRVCISSCTLTQVAVDLICTGSIVLTGGTGTFVYVFNEKQNIEQLRRMTWINLQSMIRTF